MLTWIVNKYGNMKPVVIDGFLYVVIAVCGTITAIMTSDEVYKYMNPYMVFYFKATNEIFCAAATALKMYRSTSYSEHQAEKKAKNDLMNGNSNTTVITKQETQQIVNTDEKTTPTA
jgi:hypothetical protein